MPVKLVKEIDEKVDDSKPASENIGAVGDNCMNKDNNKCIENDKNYVGLLLIWCYRIINIIND